LFGVRVVREDAYRWHRCGAGWVPALSIQCECRGYHCTPPKSLLPLQQLPLVVHEPVKHDTTPVKKEELKKEEPEVLSKESATVPPVETEAPDTAPGGGIRRRRRHVWRERPPAGARHSPNRLLSRRTGGQLRLVSEKDVLLGPVTSLSRITCDNKHRLFPAMPTTSLRDSIVSHLPSIDNLHRTFSGKNGGAISGIKSS